MSLPRNVFLTLNFEHMTLKTQSLCDPKVWIIYL